MSIRVARLEVTIVDHRLRPERVVVSSAGRHDRSRYLLVTVTDSDGVRGYGEGATTLVWSGEWAEAGRDLIEQVFAPLVVGATFDHPAQALDRLDAATVGNPFAKAAVDTALWDLWARGQGRSASSLFADREPVTSLPTRVSIGAYPPEKTAALAREFTDEGIRVLKFKVGTLGVDDVERLRRVRDELGDEPVFTVDGNGGYPTADDAVRGIEALLPFDLALVEQPTPRDRLSALAEVRRRLDLPILADEAVFTPDDLAEALDLDAFDLLSVYPGKNGGFTRALAMVRTAGEAGKGCAIGSNLESDVGQAAMAALAAGCAAFDVERHASDFASALYYGESAAQPALELRDGRLRVPSGLGFGVEPAGREE